MQGSALKLYTYFRSSTAWRVRIAMNLKKIQYEPVFINLLAGEQKNENYLKINPNSAVPSLDIGNGIILIESFAILEYLEEMYPEVKLLPEDPIKKAQVRGFCEVINSGIHPYQNLRLFEWVETKVQPLDRVTFVQPMLKRGLSALEEILKNHHGKYCFGDQLTLADLFLVPQVGGAIARFKIDLEQFPNIKDVYNNLKDIPEFVAAQPDKQPDFK